MRISGLRRAGKAVVSALCFISLLVVEGRAADAVWQWSVPMGEGRAFLWIPENCREVRAVVVGQHNMIEQGILEHPAFRQTLGDLDIAEVFVAPPFDRVFDFTKGAGERFDEMMRALAAESGYQELGTSPIVPIGHSACASFPWNFAAWNPGRTLAVLSVKGDAPQTNLTGSGAPNPDWGPRNIDGVPGLMVMSEAEWWEARVEPLLRFRAAHPATPLALVTDTGHGHFDATETLVRFLALFIRKAAEARLPAQASAGLRPVDPKTGWPVPRWRDDASDKSQDGSAADIFWSFDKETAQAIEALHAFGSGKHRQQVDFLQTGTFSPISSTHTGIELQYHPDADGVSFELAAGFITPLPKNAPIAAKDKPPPTTVVLPAPANDGDHATGPPVVSVIVGPAEQVGPNTFRVAFNRTFSTTDKRNYDVWFLASHPGDENFKGAVQQAQLRLPQIYEGKAQSISFPEIRDQPVGTLQIVLGAKSDAGSPVGYYVREGPAFVRDGVLHLTSLPPGAKLPITITVVAWQLGRAAEPKLQAAAPVTRSFKLFAP